MKELIIKLKKKDRESLGKFVKRGNSNAREITRARVLLMSDSRERPTSIVNALNVTKKTIQNIKERYLQGGIDRALYDLPRSGQPTKFNGKHRAKITALACTTAPEGHAKWSLSLLADKAVEIGIVEEISKAQVGRILKKTK